ncbi:inositol monophosphatase family protein [Sphaerisporangium sp. TRM90804]|uniref:inositol monophosphatase family protein n=1 Tax=Sphaerisporangium sp. TRM90804 TaxID=3031113 RepID=UPI00244698D3|nr:inositol monophosphatase family protein [Sphaerisporangium sp. TRM90804]MDH2424887.1 inositol monophosphatase family protein [Sphaerisporangium sp. TRM90804]
MTDDARALMPIALEAVAVARELVTTSLPGVVTSKGDRDMATEVDFAVERAVREHLARHTPAIGVLGEEEGTDGRVHNGLQWVLDPVDGTVNFVHGLPLCGVSLALVRDDTAILGVIDLPFLGSRYAAAEGGGATADDEPIKCSTTATLDAALVSMGDYAVGDDAGRLNRDRLAITRLLAARAQRVRMFGSAAIDLVWVAEGRTDACVMLANKPWDTAAGVLIAKEAGALVTDADGTPHTTASGATLAAAPGVLPELVALVGEARSGQP